MPAHVSLGCVGHLQQRERLLLKAVQQRDLAAMQQQLAAGADVSAADAAGLSCLHVAAVTVQQDMVEVLLAAGAHASALNLGAQLGSPPGCTLMQAMLAQVGSNKQGPLVLHSSGGLICQPHQCTPRCKQLAGVVQKLASAGACVQPAEGSNQDPTPLHDAAAAGCPALVGALLDAGADPASVTNNWSVLHAATSSGSLEVVQQVLGALGSSRAPAMLAVLATGLGTPPIYSHRPLQVAADRGYLEVAEALVAAGADKEGQDAEGDTALHWAVGGGHFHLVPLLVTPGNVNQRFSNTEQTIEWSRGCMPLFTAASFRHENISCWCAMAKRPECRQLLAKAAAAAVGALLAAGADASIKHELERTPLAEAAARGHPEVLQVLLEHELQQAKEPQQQQQEGGAARQLAALLHQLGVHALDGCNGSTWRLLVTLAADRLGVARMHSLWGSLKQQLQQVQQQPLARGRACQEEEAGMLALTTPIDLVNIWLDCWVPACLELAAQQSNITGPLEKFVEWMHQRQPLPPQPLSQQQQQQQKKKKKKKKRGTSLPGPVSKQHGPLQLVGRPPEQPEMVFFGPTEAASTAAGAVGVAGGADSRAGCVTSSNGSSSSSSSSGREARAKARQAAAAIRNMEPAAAAKASGRPTFCADLGLHPDTAESLPAVAAAAAGAGQWDLCMRLLRQLVMLDEGKGRAAVRSVHAAAGGGGQQRRQHLQHEAQQRQLQAALQVCDALCAAWLALRKQRVAELRECVVAAAKAMP